MEKKIKDSIEKIIRISNDYRIRGNASPVTLVKESGYVELHQQIGEEEIEDVLRLHPHLVAEWLLWSENKRGTPTWFITKGDSGNYHVEFSEEGKEFEEVSSKDEFKACAAFIKRDVERIRINIG
jgi:hypothetical protein